MNNQYKPNPDPNKIKKCDCENKYGPKPFNVSNSNVKSTANNKSN